MTREALDALIANLNPDVTGRIRILISRQPPGRVLGSFSYRGRRADDPNDTIDHEHRRSLRGLWLFSAWINNTDTRDANSLDMFRPVTADGRGVVEHYLIDFGDSFGATGEGEKVALQSWEHLLDWPEIFKNILSVGLRYPAYRDVQRSPFRSVGLFEATYFDPAAWKPAWPNPAFDQRTRDDLFWAASILARIQPVHVQAAVTAGRYREEGASTYVIDILLARRKKLLQYGFHGYLELDRPRTSGTRLRLDDLRVLGGLSASGPIAYTVRWNRTRRVDPVLTRGVLAPGTAPEIEIELAGALAAARRDEIALADDPFLTVELTRYGGARLEVHLRVAGDRVIPVAVDR